MDTQKEKTPDFSKSPHKNERGATMIEYVFLVSIMAIGCMASVGLMREGVESKFREAERGIMGFGGSDGENPVVIP